MRPALNLSTPCARPMAVRRGQIAPHHMHRCRAEVSRSILTIQTRTKVFESAQGTSENVTDLEIVEDGTDQNMLASFTDFGTQEGGALRSSDGGTIWALSSTGLPGGFFRDPDLCAA